MTKIVYNACYGDFSLSGAAIERYLEISGLEELPFQSRYRGFKRDDPILVQVVEELGEAANGRFADIKIRELEPGTKYRIDEYDGYEAVVTIDDYEWSVA